MVYKVPLSLVIEVTVPKPIIEAQALYTVHAYVDDFRRQLQTMGAYKTPSDPVFVRSTEVIAPIVHICSINSTGRAR